jgi:hypothetical protein
MSKKKLLSEAQVRRFMGLAGINPLNEMSHYKKDDEEAMEEGSYMKKDDEPLMEEEEEMDMEEEPGDADVEVDEEKIMKGLQGLKDGLEVLEDIAAGAGLSGDEEPDMDMDMGDEEPDMDMDMDDEEPDMEKELQEVNLEMTEEEIVNEVARRVAKRIVEAKRAHKKMNEALGRKTTSRRSRRK